MKKLLLAILITACLFACIHIIHFNFLPPRVVFTAGILDAVLACFAGLAVNAFWVKKDAVVLMSSSLILFFAAVTYIALVPTMVDRSISVYMLLNLQQAGNEGVSADVLKTDLENDRIIEKRFEDLKSLDMIHEQDGKLVLTGKGRLSASVFQVDMNLLHLDKEYRLFLNGQNPETEKGE